MDAYIEKPFNMKILMATDNNLIKSRLRLNQILKPISEGKVKIKSADDNFLSDVVQIIKENITDSDFSIYYMRKLYSVGQVYFEN